MDGDGPGLEDFFGGMLAGLGPAPLSHFESAIRFWQSHVLGP